MANLYESEKERQIHERAIQSLAEHYHLDEQWMREMYQDELSQLKKTAKVKGFLSVLSCRHLHERIRHCSTAQIESHTVHF